MKLNNIKYRYLFCDSLEAYNFFKKKINYTTLITGAPSILFDKKTKCHSVYNSWNSRRIKEFQQSIFEHNYKIYLKLLKNKELSRIENLAVNLSVSNFQKILFKIGSIKNIKKKESCMFIKHIINKDSHKEINPIWDKVFKNNKNFITIEYQDKAIKYLEKDRERKPNIFQRLFFAGFETIRFRVLKTIRPFLKHLNKNDKFLILVNENELILETASEYLSDGYNLIDISKLKTKKNNNKFNYKIDKIDKIFKICEPILKNRIKHWISKDYQKITLSLLKEKMYNDLKNFYNWKKTYEDFLNINNNINSKNTVLFCNAPASLKHLALKSSFNKRKIPLISFQHGVSAEISASHKYNRVFHDTSVSDIFVSFNKESANISRSNPFSNCTTINFRGSKRFTRTKKTFFSFEKSKSILYLSNNLYKGSFGSLGSWTTDADMASNEIKLIKNVFNKLDKFIYYKPYPVINHRYADRDPVIDFINKKNKIVILNKNIDARYIVSNFKVLICGTATSTLSWALMSNKPLFFVNYRNQAPLKKEAYNLLKKSVFLFDFEDKKFDKNILHHLKLKHYDLLVEWDKKKAFRERFISRFISDNSKKDYNIRNLIQEKILEYNN